MKAHYFDQDEADEDDSKYYEHPEDAARMYDVMSIRYRGENGILNFPEEIICR